jgi:regulator of cell morphogenesis and NO signaling
MTVDELMARHPETMAVFNAFGIDSCCGAHRSVHEAAAADDADESALLDALTRAIGAVR